MPMPPALPVMSLAAGTVPAPSGHSWLMVLMAVQATSSRGDGTPGREGVSGLGPLEVGKSKRHFDSQGTVEVGSGTGACPKAGRSSAPAPRGCTALSFLLKCSGQRRNLIYFQSRSSL